MDIQVATPQGWQAPQLALQGLNYAPITPVESNAGTYLQGIQVGQAATAGVMDAAKDAANALDPVNRAQKGLALQEIQLKQAGIKRAQDLMSKWSAHGSAAVTPPAAPPASGPTPSASNDAPLPQPDASTPPPATPQVVGTTATPGALSGSLDGTDIATNLAYTPNNQAAVISTAGGGSNAAPVDLSRSLPTTSPAAAPIAAPAPVPTASPTAGNALAALPDAQGTSQIGQGGPGTIYRDPSLPAGYQYVQGGDITQPPTLTRIPTTTTTVTDGQTGQQSLVTYDQNGNILHRAPLNKGMTQADKDAMGAFLAKSNDAKNSSMDALTKLQSLNAALQADTHTGRGASITGWFTDPMATGIDAESKALALDLKPSGISRFTNMDIGMVQDQAPNRTDQGESRDFKIRNLTNDLVQNYERTKYVEDRLAQGTPLNQAQNEYTNFLQANPVVHGSTINRSMPLPSEAIAAPVVTNAQQIASIKPGDYYRDQTGKVWQRTP